MSKSWGEQLKEMVEVSSIRNSYDYEKGYSNGFKDGYTQAFQQFSDMLIAKPQPIVITVSNEQFERIRKSK